MTFKSTIDGFYSYLSTHAILTSVVIIIFSAPSFAAPFELVSNTDKKLSSHFLSNLTDGFRDAYAYVDGVERDVIGDGIQSGSIYYRGFDLNMDTLFSYSDASNYTDPTPQSYVINTLNIQVKLKDDNYSVLGLSYDDLPEEHGRIDVQLWTDDTETFGGSWPASAYDVREIDDGDTFTFSVDFNATPLNYADWNNRGEIIVTAWYPSIFANSDFIVDRVKIWGDRSPAVPIPASIWLFGSGIIVLIGIARRK